MKGLSKKLVVGLAAVATLAVGIPATASAHDTPAQVEHVANPMPDGEATSALVHYHQYNCGGLQGFKQICIDLTTGYGPIVYVLNGFTTVYAGPLTYACLSGGTNSLVDQGIAYLTFDNGSLMSFRFDPNGYDTAKIQLSTQTYALSCASPGNQNDVAAQATADQSVIDAVRWNWYAMGGQLARTFH